VTLVLAAVAPLFATVFTSVTSGNWSNPATWGAATWPQAATDTVIVNHSVALDSSTPAAIAAVTIGAAGTFTSSGACTLRLNGDWTNNGSASLTNGFVYFMGAQDDTIRGSTATTFYRVVVNKSDSVYKTVLDQNVTLSYAGNAALYINQGNLITNGRNLTVSNGYVNGASPDRGRLTINGGSQVTIYYLYQWNLRYVTVNDSATVSIGTHQIANSGHRFDCRRGTVNYTGTGTNLTLYTNNAGWGWFATGGTITFNGSIATGNLSTHFRASDSAVVKFAGGAAATVKVNAWASASNASWWFNDLRVEKTGGASVRFFNGGTYAMDSLIRFQRGATVASGGGLSFCGTFQAGKGYSLASLANSGTVDDSGPVFIAGDMTGAGTFNGSGGTVTFNGAGANTVAMGAGGFYNLAVAKSGGSLTAGSDFAVTHGFNCTAGDFTLGQHTLTLGSAAARCSASVASGVSFSAIGVADTGSAIVAAAEAFPYAFTLAAGATFGARYATFRYPDTLGINIAGTIDTANDFDDCTFQHGAIAGCMLKVENNQSLNNVQNVGFSGSAGYNIEKLVNAGHIWITTGPGDRWGEAFDNDPNNLVDWSLPDAGIIQIISPVDTIDTSVVVRPSCRVKNFGMLKLFGLMVYFRIDTLRGAPSVFRDSAMVGTLDTGATAIAMALRSWNKPHPARTYVLACSTRAPFDVEPDNDTLSGSFTVSSGPPPPPAAAWTAKTPMPAGAKPCKDGAWLAYDAGTKLVYASRGNKQPDFFSYSVPKDSWKALTPWPPGIEGKLPSKGSAACADGAGRVYATKGNSTVGFHMYDAAANAWTQKKDVPLGVSNKKVKGGTGLAYGYKDTVGSPYLLKGYKNEFYRYDVPGDSWQTLTPAPVGAKEKWDKGSWLAYDFNERKIYAFKGKYMELYYYDTETDSWSGPLAPMPAAGSAGSKKAKDGSSGTYVWPVLPADSFGALYAFKGGNTREFWKYSIAANSWAEKETVPTGPFKKKVKAGGSVTTVPVPVGPDRPAEGADIPALKGNKTNELWIYGPIPPNGYVMGDAPNRDGVMASSFAVSRSSFIVSPNPLTGGFATVRLEGPVQGPVRLEVVDVMGRVVIKSPFAIRHSSVALDLRSMPAGIYLVKMESGGFTATRKLVVQR